MARAAGVEWRAVGASLEDLAATMRSAASKAPSAFAYANSGILQQAGVVLRARYIVPGEYRKISRSGYAVYTPPPNATHGPVKMAWKELGGEPFRNELGQFEKRPVEIKLFKKGQFVDRTGAMLDASIELSHESPRDIYPRQILEVQTRQKGKRSEVEVGIDSNGNAFVELRDGYAAAERGTRKRASSPVRGWWRSIRSVSGRWGTLLKKKFPDLLELKR